MASDSSSSTSVVIKHALLLAGERGGRERRGEREKGGEREGGGERGREWGWGRERGRERGREEEMGKTTTKTEQCSVASVIYTAFTFIVNIRR